MAASTQAGPSAAQGPALVRGARGGGSCALRRRPRRWALRGRAAELLSEHGPNTLPTEKATPGWRRFLDQYRSYMQLILLAAAIVSLAVKEWSTGVLLVLITVLNAVVGLRQEGKAESAMNALQAMVKATARVRRDGSEAEVPAEELVVGDVVVLAAGDEVPADGRIIEASALQIDESALTGESVPASKGVEAPEGGDLAPGEQTDMAFMHTPVTHGSGLMVITATGSETEVGKIAGMLESTAEEQTPLTRQLNTLTLWIAGAAGITMAIMFVLGAQRGLTATAVFTSAVALAIAAIPEAMPTVLQVVMSLGASDLAEHGAVLKDLASVETLGSTSAINSDKTGTLTMNQMTAVEVLDPTDRYTISGSGYELEGAVHHAAGSTDTIAEAILPYVVASDATLVDGKVVGDPTEGALLVLAYKSGLDIDATRAASPAAGDPALRPDLQAHGRLCQELEFDAGEEIVRCFVKGAAPAVMGRAASALSGGESIAWDEDLRARAEANATRMGEEGLRVMAAGFVDLDPATFDARGDLLGYVEELEITSLVGMVDPPRAESKPAVENAQQAHIRVRMVTGDDVVTGAAIAKQLGIDGEAILGAEFAALDEQERLERIERHRRGRSCGPGAQGAACRHTQEEGRDRRDDRRRRQRCPVDQGRAHRRRDGLGHRGRQERGAHDPYRRQLRDDRARRRARAQALRQPHQVRALRADLARRVRPDLPRRNGTEHRGG